MTESHALVLTHLPFAHRLATRFCKRHNLDGPLSEDIRAAAVCGLCMAARGFDVERGVSFQTYAYLCIQGQMLDNVKLEMRACRAMAERGEEVLDALGMTSWPSVVGSEPTVELSYSSQPTGEDRVLARELWRLVAGLPDRERHVVVESFYRDVSNADLGSQLSLVKVTICRVKRSALERMRRRWGRRAA